MNRSSRLDRVFDAFSHPYRRRILLLVEAGASAGVSETDVDELLAAIADDGSATQVRIELVHSHLPKLDDYGYVAWEEEAGTVRRGPQWDAVEPFLSLLHQYWAEPVDGPA